MSLSLEIEARVDGSEALTELSLQDTSDVLSLWSFLGDLLQQTRRMNHHKLLALRNLDEIGSIVVGQTSGLTWPYTIITIL